MLFFIWTLFFTATRFTAKLRRRYRVPNTLSPHNQPHTTVVHLLPSVTLQWHIIWSLKVHSVHSGPLSVLTNVYWRASTVVESDRLVSLLSKPSMLYFRGFFILIFTCALLSGENIFPQADLHLAFWDCYISFEIQTRCPSRVTSVTPGFPINPVHLLFTICHTLPCAQGSGHKAEVLY